MASGPSSSTRPDPSGLLAAVLAAPVYNGLSFRGSSGPTLPLPAPVVVTPLLLHTTRDLRLATRGGVTPAVYVVHGTGGRLVPRPDGVDAVLFAPLTVLVGRGVRSVDGLEVRCVAARGADDLDHDVDWEREVSLVERVWASARRRPDAVDGRLPDLMTGPIPGEPPPLSP